MHYSRGQIIKMFTEEIGKCLPSFCYNTLEEGCIRNRNPLAITTNKIYELYDTVVIKETFPGNVHSQIEFNVEQYRHHKTTSEVYYAPPVLVLTEGKYNGSFFSDPDPVVVNLIVDLMYYLLNGASSEGYSTMGLINSAFNDLVQENRYRYIQHNTSQPLINAKPMEL